MDVTCTCGKVFEARSAKARYCSDRCRKRKDQADAVSDLRMKTVADPGPGPVAAATAASLLEAGRLETPVGQACLVLAGRLDEPGLDTGSAMAAVARQLEAMLTTVLRGAGAATAPQQLRDELAERRRAHGA